MEEEDLEELKKKRMKDMEEGEELQEEKVREQIKRIASQFLTKEARSRLGNIRAAKPDVATEIERQLVQLYRLGRIKDRITDDDLKRLLKKIQDSGEDYDIKYRKPEG